jgi:hypothetical protein
MTSQVSRSDPSTALLLALAAHGRNRGLCSLPGVLARSGRELVCEPINERHPMRTRFEDTRSPGERSLQSQMARAPRLVPNIPEPVTTRKDTLPMENENLSHQFLPETPGERSLREQMERAPNLAPVDVAEAERQYQKNLAWASAYAMVFANAGLSMEICAGGVKVKCKTCDTAWVIPVGMALDPSVLTCPQKCNITAADPDAGMSRGVAP